jgi:uncharacterized membrane protein (UPF0127 family)
MSSSYRHKAIERPAKLTLRSRRSVFLLCGAVLLAGAILYRSGTHQPQPPLPTIRIAIKGQPLLVEVASTEGQRQRGLMFRAHLKDRAGMLFVFEEPQPLSFWMKNTAIPLSLAYLDAQGRIVELVDMAPFDRTEHHAATPARYALEVNHGWFATNSVMVGDVVVGIP